MQRIFGSVLTFLYPQRCLGCEAVIESAEAFCASCHSLIHRVESPLCVCCGTPFAISAGPDHLCGRCLAHPPAFRRARAWAFYQRGASSRQPLSSAIQRFKYHRNLSIGKRLAELGAIHCPMEDPKYDLIIPVPLHLERLRWRGFNQALLLSHTLGQAKQIGVDPLLLTRTRPTASQTQLTESERRANVRGAFAVAFPERLKDKRVLLVDDVYTSGATVDECARTLCRSGAQVVDVFTLARATLQ